MTDPVSCIIVDDEPLAIELLTEQLSGLFDNMRIAACCTRWEDAYELLRVTGTDILFLDISMPGKNGLDLLKMLPGLDCEIIFNTAHEEYALEAFHFMASGYLLKPVSDDDLAQAVNRAMERVYHRRAARTAGVPAAHASGKMGIPGKYGIDYVNIKDIVYLESVNKCTRVVTTGKEYMGLSPLVKFKAFTDDHAFLQVHRSFIINPDYILRYETSGAVTMTNKQSIPVARGFRNDLLNRLNKNF